MHCGQSTSDLLGLKNIVTFPLVNIDTLSKHLQSVFFEGTLSVLEDCLPAAWIPSDVCQEILDYVTIDFASWTDITFMRPSTDSSKSATIIYSSGARTVTSNNQRMQKDLICLDSKEVDREFFLMDAWKCHQAWKVGKLPPALLHVPIACTDQDYLSFRKSAGKEDKKYPLLSLKPPGASHLTYGDLFQHMQMLHQDLTTRSDTNEYRLDIPRIPSYNIL